MQHKWKRRDFLRNTALASLLAPVAGFWHDLVEAQEIAGKTNMILVFLPNGKTGSNPFIVRENGTWKFGAGFAPYEKHRADVIAFEKYSFNDFTAQHYAGDHGGHFANALCMFSGEVPYVEDAIGRGCMAPSIDQIVAWDYLNRGVITDPLRKSLNIRMTGGSFKHENMFFQTPPDYVLNKTYTTELSGVSQMEKPIDGFKRMFEGLTSGNGGETVDRLWQLGKSILDVPTAELKSLHGTLPADGKAILDHHIQSLRDLETSFASEVPPGEPPPEPTDIAVNPTNHQQIFRQWVQIIDSALRLDRTRIVTLQLGGCASRFSVPELNLGSVGTDGDNSGDDHHSYTHWQEPEVELFLKWFADRNVELLDALKGDGTTARPDVLKSSAMMIGCEFGHNHVAHDVPVLLFGGANGFFKTGQVVTYGNDLAHYHKHTGTLLSVCHAMGSTGLNAVGRVAADYQKGALPELRP